MTKIMGHCKIPSNRCPAFNCPTAPNGPHLNSQNKADQKSLIQFKTTAFRP